MIDSKLGENSPLVRSTTVNSTRKMTRVGSPAAARRPHYTYTPGERKLRICECAKP